MIFPNRLAAFLMLSYGLSLQPLSFAAESAAELLPRSTILYVEIEDPAGSIDSLLQHPYFANLQTLQPAQEFMRSPQYLQGMTILRIVEFQLGMPWREAVQGLSANGVSLAFDAETQGLAILFQAESPEKLIKVRDKIVALARQDAKKKNQPDPYEIKQYRGIDVYTTKQGGFLTHENWLIVGNQSELGKHLVDALLDAPPESLATNINFQQAQSQRPENSIAWGFMNLEPLQATEDPGLKKLFSGKADDPVGELLLGGILESLTDAPYICATLAARSNGLSLSIQMPHATAAVSDLREHYFGPAGIGEAAPIQEVPEMLFGLSAYRNVSEMWLRAGDLFNEKVNDGFAQADSQLSTFFSGKDFGEEILGALTPQIQIIAARQTYSEGSPVPAIKLPAFALLAEMKDPAVTTREFRRIYQSFIGFFNVVGAMNGQPQFELGFESLENCELISATPIPLAGEETDQLAKINFNFSPTVGFSGKRLVVASTTDLAKSLALSQSVVPQNEIREASQVNTQMQLNIPELQIALANNKSHLIAQNMLKEGHTREEAKTQIGILLEVLTLFEQSRLSLFNQNSTLNLNLEIELSE